MSLRVSKEEKMKLREGEMMVHRCEISSKFANVAVVNADKVGRIIKAPVVVTERAI